MMRLTSLVRFSYVQSLRIQEIKKSAQGKSAWQWIKAELQVGKFIMSEGYRQFKKDVSYYYSHFNKPLLPAEHRRMYEIRSNLLKVPPIAILFWFPGGLPIVLLYMAYLPALTPTWFLRDSYQHVLEEQRLNRQKKAFQYFVNCGSITEEAGPNKQYKTTLSLPVFGQMGLMEQKKVHELCFGETFDGTEIINRTFNTKLNSLFSQHFSSFLLQRNMEEKLQSEQPDGENDKLTTKVLREANKINRL